MSDQIPTPRTDAASFYVTIGDYGATVLNEDKDNREVIEAELSRTLERELATALRERNNLATQLHVEESANRLSENDLRAELAEMTKELVIAKDAIGSAWLHERHNESKTQVWHILDAAMASLSQSTRKEGDNHCIASTDSNGLSATTQNVEAPSTQAIASNAAQALSDPDLIAAKERAEWLHYHNAPKDWVVLTTSEVAFLRAKLADAENAISQLAQQVGESSNVPLAMAKGVSERIEKLFAELAEARRERDNARRNLDTAREAFQHILRYSDDNPSHAYARISIIAKDALAAISAATKEGQ